MLRFNHSDGRCSVGVAVLCALPVLVSSCARPESGIESSETVSELVASRASDEASLDQSLQRAAAEAMGDREGAVLVMEPQTGRLRAVVNPRVAFEQAFPPGSSIKPFAALAAMRAGMVDAESRTLCRGRYRRGEFQTVCSHPKSATAFDLTHALAYSCNVYFAGVAERLSASSFRSMLASFGLGARTGVNSAGESDGTLSAGEWRVEDGLGGGDHLLVTPVQLLTAYAALMNGGHLYRPRLADSAGFASEERSSVRIDAAERAALLKGCRAAIEYGTASQGGLASLPLFVFGKTGTSSSSNGFRTQGWFVSFAAEASAGPEPPPESLRLAVLVFLRRAHGSDGVEVAQRVFEAYARGGEGRADTETRGRGEGRRGDGETGRRGDVPPVRVRLLLEGVTETLSVEEYLLGVLQVEAAAEDELEALKAQAVVSRTYTLKNLGRHASEGYDLCSSTHCQQYKRTEAAGAIPRSIEAYRRAISETEGQVLADDAGRLADVYFSAACGGMTANIESLWGAKGPSYLRGVRDDYCATGEHRAWRDEIPRAQLMKALGSDPRSEVGSRLDDIVITKRDATGRAELISLEGERRRQLRGWEFKIIVGRALGWQVLKSTRFDVSRRGATFVFRGSGFGHGLGLCQEGAHVMAHRGNSYMKILDHYLPGAGINAKAPRREDARQGLKRTRRTSGLDQSASDRAEPARLVGHHPSAFAFPICSAPSRLSALALSSQRHLASGHFRVSYPATEERSEVEAVLRTLESAREDLAARIRAASLSLPDSVVEVIAHPTTQDFAAATGQPWWAAGATKGKRIQLQPLAVLRRRRVLTTTLRHEYTHAVIEAIGNKHTPRWLAEGLAVHFAGEGPMLRRYSSGRAMPLAELERQLQHPVAATEMRSLYSRAYNEVRALINKEGEANVWRRVAGTPT
ncbi:MAG TPA: SpoIID/LytB domain-containing protein [Blastocatellia bacterium]|nr:SpoIID/LytB domain-containing protein [Blastocatellia bacterium]